MKILKLLCIMPLISEICMESFLSKFYQSDYSVQFERLQLLRYNKVDVKNLGIRTFKYNRTCAVANLTFLYNIDIGTEMQVIVQAYKFASNEYRLFPLRFEVNYCDALNYNIIGLERIWQCGNFTGCPIVKGLSYHICNFAPDGSKFPPNIPSGNYMVELQALYRAREIWVMQAYATISRPIVKTR